MRDLQNLPAEVAAQLADVHELSPADELATYERVLTELTELLNAPEEHGPGDQ
ncbi:hypothetical protein [Enteractinococcus helveticum]|uniref:hypothetical protein n=1 Tax=Enteractinococcus helveticum TaxID=1837282 RepID=UPI000B020640|nr:hypothetical protein [Enteractinococcus helveticum]